MESVESIGSSQSQFAVAAQGGEEAAAGAEAVEAGRQAGGQALEQRIRGGAGLDRIPGTRPVCPDQ